VGTFIGVSAVILFNEVNEDNSGTNDRPTGDDVRIDDKIKGQLGERGWTEVGVRDLTNTEPSGTSVDNTHGRNDSATVYGARDGGHIVVNDKTGDVVQVSDRNDPDWDPDSRIDWKEDLE